MSIMDRLFPKAATNGRAPVSAPPPADDGLAAPLADGMPESQGTAELQERRQRLAQELAERQWDLGGMTYEMAIRDHFRLDVIVAHAAKLQEIDAELAEIERLLTLEEQGATGYCPACGSPHSRGAVYCWSCGTQLIATQETQT